MATTTPAPPPDDRSDAEGRAGPDDRRARTDSGDGRAAGDATGRPPNARARLIASSLGFAVVQLDVSVVNVAIRPIGASLGGGVSALQWVVNAYTVVFAALILSAGALGDRVGARRVFVGGFAVFTVASAACGAAPSLGVLIAARAVQGLGAAALVPCSLALLNHAFEGDRERARAVGLWAVGASVALTAGPLVGGVLTQAVGWRAIFLVNVPIGAAGIWLTVTRAVETPRATDRGVDVAGQLAAVVALAALAGATIEAGVRGLGDPAVLAGFAVAAAVAVAFVRIEARGSSPMLPLGLFRSRTFSATAAIGFVINVAFYGLIFLLSLDLQDARGLSALQTGLAFAPATLAVMAANAGAGRIAEALGVRRTLAGAALLMTASLAAMTPTGPGSPLVLVLAPLTTLGLGLGIVVPVVTSALLGTVDRSRSGVASGTLNTARQAGSVVGVALFGALAAGGLAHGLHVALVVCVGLGLVTLALALRVGGGAGAGSAGGAGSD